MPAPALLAGKSVLVTGAGAGIGRSVAIAAARAGASVAVMDIDPATTTSVAAQVADCGAESLALVADVADESQVAELLSLVSGRWGRLDCAVNNAGIEGSRHLLGDYPAVDFDEVVRVNLRGTFVCLQQELRLMAGQGSGSIVNVSSAAAITPATNMPAYSATKAAVLQLTRSAALDYGPVGIRVNAVCPGPVRTAMQQRLRGPDADLTRAAVPLGRSAHPDEIAAAVVWLCSDSASYVTGHPLVVDGGCVIQGPRHHVSAAP